MCRIGNTVRPTALKGLIPFESLWTVRNVRPSYTVTTINNVKKLCVCLHVYIQIYISALMLVHPLWSAQMPLAYN